MFFGKRMSAKQSMRFNISEYTDCVVYRDNGRNTTLLYKNIYVLLFFRKESNLWNVWETQTKTGRQRQTAILTHNIFSWLYHAVLSSRPHLLLLQLLGQGRTQPEARFQWLQPSTDSGTQIFQWPVPSHGHMHISFHNAHDFQSTTWLPSVYLHMFREISDWWLRSRVIIEQLSPLRRGKASPQ